MGRSPCCDESGLKKGPWTPDEDEKLVEHIQKHGHGSWRALPKLAGLNRCGKSCRLRWTNYLRPDIRRGKFSQDEEQTILNLHSILGNKWSAIATHLPGRTDNEIKNFWNTHLKKKLIQMGFDPMTHQPRTDLFSSLPQLLALANLTELMEHHHSWDELAGRLQTEAAQMVKLQYLQYLFQPPPPSLLNTNSSNISDNDMIDMETFNVLAMNSFSSNKDISNTPTLNTPVLDCTVQSSLELNPFSHLPDLQDSCSFQTPLNKEIVESLDFTVFNQGENFYSLPTPPWFPSSSSSPSAHVAEPPIETTSIPVGDVCSTSINGGEPHSFWPEFLLEDPFFQ